MFKFILKIFVMDMALLGELSCMVTGLVLWWGMIMFV